MKLIFRKKEENSIQVLIRTGVAEDEFNYVKMVKSLINKNKFEDTEYDGDFSEKETECIKNMLIRINQVIEENSTK